jgi:hypothetical protein
MAYCGSGDGTPVIEATVSHGLAAGEGGRAILERSSRERPFDE